VLAHAPECGVADRVIYKSFLVDNTRWDALTLRDGDIVISTPSKCGTTWTQMLVALLVFDGPDFPGALSTVSPWLDMRIRPLQEVVGALDAQRHRRFIKTHTPLDGLRLDDRVTYIGVGRDPRDAAVSMAHHSANMDRDRLNELRHAAEEDDGLVDEGRTDEPRDPAAQFREWIERPNTPGEGMESLATIAHHFLTFWARRDEPNVALFHYADYTADLPGELGRLASVLGYDVSPERVVELAAHARLDAMRGRATDLAPNTTDGLWRSNERFFRAGGQGEWRAIFTEADERRYEQRVAELVPPPLAAWMHGGRSQLDSAFG
jgi:hypothetical protein